MTKGKRGLLFLIFLILGFGIYSAANSKTPAHSVLIKNMQFEPASLEINSGETVVWTNQDIVPHTVTKKGAFDSGVISADGTFKRSFKKKGEYPYGCSLHTNMTGK